MRIVIDLQGAQSASRWRGIGRYSVSLVETIARLRGDHEIVIVLSDAFPETLVALRSRFAPLVGAQNVRVWSAPMPVRGHAPDNAERRARAEIILEGFIASLKPGVLFVSSHFEGYGDDAVTSIKRLDTGVPVAVTLYDLIPLHDPKRYLKPNPAWERFYTEKLEALKRADLLLAISDFSARDAERRFGTEGRSIVNMSGACSDIFRPSDMPTATRAALKARLGIDRAYVITSGTIEPHKNLSTLFAAFSGLPRKTRDGHLIVLVGHVEDGQRAIYRNMLKSAGLTPSSLVITGYVNDAELVALYSDARLMVFPSMDEGFGLPPLEAMSCGTPTIGSSASSIPEVIGLTEAQFDPRDTAGLTKLMERGLGDEAFREILVRNAAERAQVFTWERTARIALDALVDLSKRHAGGTDARSAAIELCLDALAETAPDPEAREALGAALAYDFPEPGRKPRLFVDISELRVRDVRTGCQRVTRSVLQAWLNAPPAGYVVEPVYATTDVAGYVHARAYVAQLTGVPVEGTDEPIDYAAGDVFFGLDLCPPVIVAQRDYLARMRRRGVITRFLVYDLLPVQMPDYFPEGTEPMFEAWLRTLLVADGIVGISRATIEGYCGWQGERGLEPEGPFDVAHVHLGADLDGSLPTTGMPDDAEAVLARLAACKTFLSVGTIEPRKGHAQVLDAFELLWSEGVEVNLVFVGKLGWNVERLAKRLRNHPESGRRLIWLAGVSDEYLTRVYRTATCLLAASLGEGFGLPLIEAAQAGLPVLARDLDVFREVAGEHAAYFEAATPRELAEALQGWMARHAEGRTVGSQGMKWMTWADCAVALGEAAVRAAPTVEAAAPDLVVAERVRGFRPSRKRILVSKLDHMGDLLLALPAISRLRARYPAARLDLLCGSWNEAMARQLGLFDAIYTFDFFKQKSSTAPEVHAQELAEIHARIGACDLVIDLRRQPDSRFVVAGIQARERVGYATNIADVDARLTITLPHFDDIPFETTPLNRTHITRQMLALVDAIPAELDDYIQLPPLAENLSTERRREVALFPKAGNAIKEWGDARFAELARDLAADETVEAVNCYFANTTEAEAAGFVSAGKIRVHAGLSFAELLTSLAHNRVCVANNSFGVHIASYIGVEVVGVFGGHETSAEWAPYFGDNTVLRRPVPCSPCHLAGPEHCTKGLLCLDIPVAVVCRYATKALTK